MGSCYSNQIVLNDGSRLLPIYDNQMGVSGIVGLAIVSADSRKYSRVRISKYKRTPSRPSSVDEQENEASL